MRTLHNSIKPLRYTAIRQSGIPMNTAAITLLLAATALAQRNVKLAAPPIPGPALPDKTD